MPLKLENSWWGSTSEPIGSQWIAGTKQSQKLVFQLVKPLFFGKETPSEAKEKPCNRCGYKVFSGAATQI